MMNVILNSLNRLHRDEAGQGLVEYLLLLGVVAFSAIFGMQGLANDLNSAFTTVGGNLGKYIK